MTKSNAVPKTANPFAAAFAPFSETFAPHMEMAALNQTQAMDAWMQLNRAVLEGVGKMQQEASRFVVQRLEDDLVRQRRILECRSPEEVWQLWSDFARKAVQDYTDEAGRLSEIAAEVQYACAGFGEVMAGSATEPATEPRRKSAA